MECLTFLLQECWIHNIHDSRFDFWATFKSPKYLSFFWCKKWKRKIFNKFNFFSWIWTQFSFSEFRYLTSRSCQVTGHLVSPLLSTSQQNTNSQTLQQKIHSSFYIWVGFQKLIFQNENLESYTYISNCWDSDWFLHLIVKFCSHLFSLFCVIFGHKIFGRMVESLNFSFLSYFVYILHFLIENKPSKFFFFQ